VTNFTQEIKREAAALFPEKDCCKRAAFAALIAVSGNTRGGRIEFISESERVSEYFFALAEYFGLTPELAKTEFDPMSGKNRMYFFAEGEEAARAAEDIDREDLSDIAARSCCAAAYLRAAFLGGGSCTLPRDGGKSGYHLEFVFPEERTASDFLGLMESLELLGRMVARGDKFVVYLKRREVISDCLSVLGADGALTSFASVSAVREEHNFVNRVSNCMTGNADKSAIASAAQALKIEKLKQNGIFETLPPVLKELAELRLENPTLSLAELAEKANVSKSCLNHRLRKLMNLSEKTEEKS